MAYSFTQSSSHGGRELIKCSGCLELFWWPKDCLPWPKQCFNCRTGIPKWKDDRRNPDRVRKCQSSTMTSPRDQKRLPDKLSQTSQSSSMPHQPRSSAGETQPDNTPPGVIISLRELKLPRKRGRKSGSSKQNIKAGKVEAKVVPPRKHS